MGSAAIIVRPKAIWRFYVRILAVFILAGVCIFWAAKGAHRGWTQNRVPVKQSDPITEIEFVTYEDRFVPGVDILGGGIAFGLLLLGASFIGSRPSAAS